MKKNIFCKKRIRSLKLRKKNKNSNLNRLMVYKTSKHIYAKIFSIDNKKIIISLSTSNKKIKKYLKSKSIYTGNKESAKLIGKLIAKKSLNNNINKVFLDRCGFKFHGRIKCLTDNAKINGLIF